MPDHSGQHARAFRVKDFQPHITRHEALTGQPPTLGITLGGQRLRLGILQFAGYTAHLTDQATARPATAWHSDTARLESIQQIAAQRHHELLTRHAQLRHCLTSPTPVCRTL